MRNHSIFRFLLFSVIGINIQALSFQLEDSPRLPRQANESNDNPCKLPEYPQFGKWSVAGGSEKSPGQNVPPLSVVIFDCLDGYKLASEVNKYSVCSNGQWSAKEIPKCLRKCPPLKNTTTTNIKCESQDRGSVSCEEATEGVFASFTCAPFYESTDRNRRLCSGGVWNLPSPVCQPLCGRRVEEAVALGIPERQVSKGDYPWTAIIFLKQSEGYTYACTGTILSRRIILTAAHCVTNHLGEPRPVEEVAVGVGKYYNKYKDPRDIEAQYAKVEKLIVPAFYKGDVTRYLADIAAVIIQDALLFSKSVQPVCYNNLPSIHLTKGLVGAIAGYEFPKPNGKIPEELYETQAAFKPEEDCRAKFPADWADKYYTPDKMCAGYSDKTTCINSGAGLTFKNPEDNRYYIHGILSIGLRGNNTICNEETDPLYTNVTFHYDWLEKIYLQYNTV